MLKYWPKATIIQFRAITRLIFNRKKVYKPPLAKPIIAGKNTDKRSNKNLHIINRAFMKILKIRTMRGPNYWSAKHHQLIVLNLQLPDPDPLFIEKIIEFGKKMVLLKNFFQHLDDSKTICQMTAQLAIELQVLAGMNCRYYQTHVTNQHQTCNVIFEYTIENAGVYAAEAAVRMINSIAEGKEYDIELDIKRLKRINRNESLGPSTRAIVNEALSRNIPVSRVDDSSLMLLGQGCNQRIIRAAVASTTSSIAADLVGDKESTKKILDAAYIPTPRGSLVANLNELKEAVESLGFPLVIKPLNGNHGRGITTMIESLQEAEEAFHLAQKISKSVIVERHIQGHDFRFLVINFKLIAVAQRTPAKVIGNGFSTIKELIDEVNQDPRRGDGHENVLTAITIDHNTLILLSARDLTPESVIPAEEILYLKDTANISTGGTADDVTDEVHPKNVFLAERVARLMNLDICGIDVMVEDIAKPITEQSGAVLEVNAAPGLRMHLAPASGLPINVAAPIVAMLYPKNAISRIPVVAITGTNGKTTTVRLIAHLAKQAGHQVGFTTTDGISISDQIIATGDCSGPGSAAVVLKDPLVNFAVLECARGGILRAGLGFDQCDISIVTNISEDHLGMEDIETVNDLARVKEVVPLSTAANGYAILNADDELVYQMKNDLICQVALFALSAGNPNIKQHLLEGKIAAFIEENYFTICKGAWKYRVAKVDEVPLTMGGKSEVMMKNILPAILAAFISNFEVKVIHAALKSFKPSPENTPGRMNLFEFTNCKVTLDYAHNEGGYQELKKYAAQVVAPVKVGIIAVAGDRRDQDIRNIGSLAAEIFDQIIIRHNKNSRGRSNEDNTALLMDGVRKVKPEMPVSVISDEKEAVQYAIEHSSPDTWIFMNLDKVKETLDFVAALWEKDKLQHKEKSIVQ
jgi:cyanophycin synthetase